MLKRRKFIQGVGTAAAAALGPFPAVAAPVSPVNGYQPPALDLDLTYRDTVHLAPPPNPFASNHNYFIYGGGQPIRGLVVTIEVTEDIVAPQGLGMQLNAYSPTGANCKWQQYTTGFNPSKSAKLTIGWGLENWASADYQTFLIETLGQPKGNNIFNVNGTIGTFPAPSDRIPAGYKIRYELLYDANDPGGAIIGANYTVRDKHWYKTTGPRDILAYKVAKTDQPVPKGALAPIVALQLNLVGRTNGEQTFVRTGAGTITYEATGPLTPQGKHPRTAAYLGGFTAESSHIRYAELGSFPSRRIGGRGPSSRASARTAARRRAGRE